MITTFTIAKLTFREAARRKILIAAFLLGLAFLIVYGIGFYYVNKEIGDTVGRNPLENNEIRNFLFMAGMYAVNCLVVIMAVLTSVAHVYADIIFTSYGWWYYGFGQLDIRIYGSKYSWKLSSPLGERHSPAICFLLGWVNAFNTRQWRTGVWSLRSRLHWWLDRAYWFPHQQSDCNQHRHYLQLNHSKRSTLETCGPRNVFPPR